MKKTISFVTFFLAMNQSQAFFDGFDMTTSQIDYLVMQSEFELQKTIAKENQIAEMTTRLQLIQQQLNDLAISYQQIHSSRATGQKTQGQLIEAQDLKMQTDILFAMQKLSQQKNELLTQLEILKRSSLD